jgi:hypothetical protein
MANSPNPPTQPLDVYALAAAYLLSELQTAAILDVSPGTLSVWRSTGRYALKYIKVGRNVRYRAGDIRQFLESRLKNHTGEK